MLLGAAKREAPAQAELRPTCAGGFRRDDRNINGKKPSVNSVDSVRASLLWDSCADTFGDAFRCFPERRKTRTEVTEFTEGLPPLELAVRLPS
jgi:hypothetical protein